MSPDHPPPAAPSDEDERLKHEELDPEALSSARREALLRRILQRTGGAPPLAPAEPHTPD